MKTSITLAILALTLSLSAWATFRQPVIGGKDVPKGLIPSVFMLPNACTATFIGERVFITAAHCLEGRAQDVKIFGKKAHLVAHPKYNPDHFSDSTFTDYFDVAIGIMSEVVDNESTQNPASLCSVTDQASLLHQKVLLVGYGCNKWPEATGGKMKRYGYSIISEIKKDFLKSTVTDGTGLSCPGDSGSPYLLINRDSTYCYISTNFHSDRVSENRSVNVFYPEVKNWIEKFVKDAGVEVCGVNFDCGLQTVPDEMKL